MGQPDIPAELPLDPSRFEHLAGRFFDGALSVGEDQELAGLLSEHTELARRFVEQAWMERLVAGTADPRRQTDPDFARVVRRSLELSGENGGSAEFAEEVVKAVRARALRRAPSRTGRAGSRVIPFAIAGMCAAVFLAVIIKFTAFSASPDDSAVTPFPDSGPVQYVELKHRDANEDAPATPPESTVPNEKQPPLASEKLPVPPETPTHADPLKETPEPPGEINAARARNDPVQNPVALALGRVGRMNGAMSFRIPAGEKDEGNLNSGAMLFDGDRVRVPLLDTGKGATIKPDAELVLADGSVLQLSAGAMLTMHAEKSSQRPILETGELTARIKPQLHSTLAIATRQGAEAAVLGTVFKLSAQPEAKRVVLVVQEGRVQFSNGGEKRAVIAGQFCMADDGMAPGQPAWTNPRLAALSGVVTEKSSGRPVANATVVVTPLAERRNSARHRGTKTDADGKFVLEDLAEGNMFVAVTTDSSTGPQSRVALARVKLIGGEKSTINFSMDRALVCLARVTENGKPVSDCNLRLIGMSPVSADGRTYKTGLILNNKSAGEYQMSLEPPGRFSAVFEKPGFLIHCKGTNSIQLRSERMTLCKFEVQVKPSAVVKGKVLNAATGAVLADGSDEILEDPRSPRTVLTLAMPDGFVQSALTEADGTFMFDTNMDSGAYELSVERSGSPVIMKRFKLQAGEVLEINPALETFTNHL